MILLRDLSTLPPEHLTKNEGLKQLGEWKKELAELQNMLYAQNRFSVLIILQGMDASGKDGLIRNAFSSLNPAGIRVYSWGKPTEEEAAHDFLWRIHQSVPRRRMMHVFNRSHYEDILVPSVHKTHPPQEIEKRYRLINDFELLLKESGTTILKFYLHVSEEEQRERLAERQTNPAKMWKYVADDHFTLKYRDEFIRIYEEVFRRCSEHAPWHILPSDKNWYKEYGMLNILLTELKKLPLSYPEIKEK
jgi:PPK2 family polyphosphate:nucleotide phosphotransferase